MSRESDFLLGTCFATLKQIRAYLIKRGDEEGIALIEDDYQALSQSIFKGFSLGEAKDGY